MFRFIRKLIINRSFTQTISYLIDNFLPPILRNNKYFMYPFFYFAYKGKNVDYFMNFKSLLYTLDSATLEKLYQNYDTIGTERETDLTKKSIKYFIKHIDKNSKTILDVACGKGFLANKFVKMGYTVSGVDVHEDKKDTKFSYTKGNIENLPLEDQSFDIVTSTHTLEHIIDIKKAVNEIKRIAKKQIIIVVPCQNFYYYTLDMHIHFFPQKEMLTSLIGLETYSIKKVGGDWIYIGKK